MENIETSNLYHNNLIQIILKELLNKDGLLYNNLVVFIDEWKFNQVFFNKFITWLDNWLNNKWTFILSYKEIKNSKEKIKQSLNWSGLQWELSNFVVNINDFLNYERIDKNKDILDDKSKKIAKEAIQNYIIKSVDKIETINEYVYCDKCKTIVSVNSCPHGSHHHISYHSDSIFELIKTGLIPPTILMRKEISAKYLAYLYPNRFKNLQKLYYDISPNKGLIEESKEEDFYISLMKLYQTSSLT